MLGFKVYGSPSYTQDQDGKGGVARPLYLQILGPESSL